MRVTATLLELGLVVSLLHSSSGAAPPLPVSDTSGNYADNNSHIQWAALPEGAPYKTSASGDHGALAFYFDIASSYSESVLRADLGSVVKFANKTMNELDHGGVNYGSLLAEVLKMVAGYLLSIVVGILFFLIFPLIGCCFCCCRCCNNCGGKMLQKQRTNDNCKRIVFSIILFLLAIVAGVATICMYATANETKESLDTLPDRVLDVLDDSMRFLNNTKGEVKHLTFNNFNFTKRVLFRDLDSIGVILGEPVQEKMNDIGVKTVVDSALQLSANVDSVEDGLASLERNLTELGKATNQLQKALAHSRADIKAALQLLTGAAVQQLLSQVDRLDIAFDASKLPNISSEIQQVQDVKSKNLTQRIEEGKKEFDNIPDTVEKETKSVVKGIKYQVGNFSETVEDKMQEILDLSESVELTDTLDSVENEVMSYKKYISIASPNILPAVMGLASLPMLIIVCLLCGLICGTCGYQQSADPTQRSCLSNSGGNCLMAATGFIFIFSPLMTLLTLLLFAPLAPIERYACQTLEDPRQLDSLVESVVPLLSPGTEAASSSWLAEQIFGNVSISLTLGGVLQSCRQNEALYSSLQLDQLPQIKDSLQLLSNYKDELNLTAEIQQINIDFKKMSIMNNATKLQLTNFKDALGKIDFNKFESELNLNATNLTLSSFASDLKRTNDVTLVAEATKLEDIERKEAARVTSAKNKVLLAVRKLNSTMWPLPELVQQTVDGASEADAYLQANGTAAVKEQALAFGKRLFFIADQFKNKTLNSLKQEVARCRPLYNFYEFATQVPCAGVVDTLNGLWLGLGWCVFLFLPSMIFAVKLAKHFRRMQYKESYDDSDAKTDPNALEMSKISRQSLGRHNKVGVHEPDV